VITIGFEAMRELFAELQELNRMIKLENNTRLSKETNFTFGKKVSDIDFSVILQQLYYWYLDQSW
jgi:hypothetical protein